MFVFHEFEKHKKFVFKIQTIINLIFVINQQKKFQLNQLNHK